MQALNCILLPTHAVTPTTVHTAHLNPILTSVHVAQTQVTQANISQTLSKYPCTEQLNTLDGFLRSI